MLPERLRQAQKELLSFDMYDTDAAWLSAVAGTLTPLAGTEQVYYTGPTVDHSRKESAFLVAGAGIDDAFKDRISSDFRGYLPNGDSEFAEEYSTFLHQMVRQSGPSMVHDAPLYDEYLRKDMILHAEAFEPAGILRQLALSVPRQTGESLIIFGYADGAQPDQDSETFRDLGALLPVWERALRLKQHHGAQAHWQTGIDLLPTPIVVTGPAGTIYANRAFEILPISFATREHLAVSANAIGQRLLRSLGFDEMSAKAGFECPVQCPEGVFRLMARLDTASSMPVALVTIEQPQTLPPSAFLRSHYRLSPREVEALALMVACRTDKDIARTLDVAFHTARQYSAAVLRKVGAARSNLQHAVWNAYLTT